MLTTSTHQAAMSAGMERLIPVRFVLMSNCSGVACPLPTTYEEILQSVQLANQVYKAAGVQLYIEVVEPIEMTNIVAAMDARESCPQGECPLIEIPFSSVKHELAAMFPAMPPNAWAGDETKVARHWLHSVAMIYEPARRFTTWVYDAGDENSSTAGPESGSRGIRMNGNHMGGWAFAHEFGHFLGLRHTFGGDDGVNARTLFPRSASRRWDLMYKPGTSAADPHEFYDSAPSAAYDNASLRTIDKRVCPIHCPSDCGNEDVSCPNHLNTNHASQGCGSCRVVDGVVNCHVGESSEYWEQHSAGDWELKGVAPMVGSTAGSNIMTYLPDNQRALSDSQIQLIQEYLRFDVPLDDDVSYVLEGYMLPTPDLGGRRPRLGNYGERVPAEHLDFDGDGRRDIGLWVPPDQLTNAAGDVVPGQFIVLLSTHSYSFSHGFHLRVDFGALGDLPVPADYNGDGRTDIAVYQPGGGIHRNDPRDTTGYWRWCVTASPAESTTCNYSMIQQWGERNDTPQPGLNFDNVPGAELSVYRPRNGIWYSRNVSGRFAFSRQIGHIGAGVVPLGGNYDCDDKADLAVYEPSTARFKLLRSEQSWGTMITHQFDTAFIPWPSGTQQARAGATAVGGFSAGKLCGSPFAFSKRVRAAAVYFPYDSTWNMLWDVTGATKIQSCSLGSGDASNQIVGGLQLDPFDPFLPFISPDGCSHVSNVWI